MKTLFAALTFALLPAWFPSAGAFAHARLVSAVPAVGATVNPAPSELVLRFTEAIEPRFSTVAVTDAAGARQERGDLQADSADAKTIRIGLLALKPGTYTVRWQVLSVDTHRAEGAFRFTVAP